MKKIVTIDFDIIMGPSIGVYNDLVDDEYSVEDFIADNPCIENALPADFYIYEYLTRYIIRCAKAGIKIDFIDNHKDVVELTRDIKLPFELINLDHHHDVNYDEDDKVIIKPEAGNWVKYLKDRKRISKYTWIKNDNATLESYQKPYIDEMIEFADSHLERLVGDTERLILCLSPEWVPPQYHSLFLTWQTIVEELTK